MEFDLKSNNKIDYKQISQIMLSMLWSLTALNHTKTGYLAAVSFMQEIMYDDVFVLCRLQLGIQLEIFFRWKEVIKYKERIRNMKWNANFHNFSNNTTRIWLAPAYNSLDTFLGNQPDILSLRKPDVNYYMTQDM